MTQVKESIPWVRCASSASNASQFCNLLIIRQPAAAQILTFQALYYTIRNSAAAATEIGGFGSSVRTACSSENIFYIPLEFPGCFGFLSHHFITSSWNPWGWTLRQCSHFFKSLCSLNKHTFTKNSTGVCLYTYIPVILHYSTTVELVFTSQTHEDKFYIHSQRIPKVCLYTYACNPTPTVELVRMEPSLR